MPSRCCHVKERLNCSQIVALDVKMKCRVNRGLMIEEPIHFFLVVTKVGSHCCKLPINTIEEDQEEIHE